MPTAQTNPRTIWLWGLVLINTIALIWMLVSGEFLGDVVGPIHGNVTNLILAFFSVVISYYVFLGPVFNFTSRISVKAIKPRISPVELNKSIGRLLILLQLGFWGFNYLYGVNIAGSRSSEAKADFLVSIIWVIVPVDALFLIYYSFARDTVLWRYNLLIYISSNLVRGWSGMLFLILFMEFCRAFRLKKITPLRLVLFLAIIIAAYPFISNLKFLFRGSISTDFVLLDALAGYVNQLVVDDYFRIVVGAFQHLVGRIQITSAVEEVIRNGAALRASLDSDAFAPFWLEGLHGIAYDRLFLPDVRPTLGFELAYQINSAKVRFNVNPGWVGWLYVAPYLIPVYCIYTMALCFASFWFAKKIGSHAMLFDLIWLSWFSFLVTGWLATFVAFIYALAVYLLLTIFLSYFKDFRFHLKSR